jgi:hypothetical protein
VLELGVVVSGLVGLDWIGVWGELGFGEGCNDFVDENRESASEVPGSGV